LLCTLPNQFLQVVWILLQHLKHRIDEINFPGKIINMKHNWNDYTMYVSECDLNY
jgi:hypothetical protein